MAVLDWLLDSDPAIRWQTESLVRRYTVQVRRYLRLATNPGISRSVRFWYSA